MFHKKFTKILKKFKILLLCPIYQMIIFLHTTQAYSTASSLYYNISPYNTISS